MLVSPDDTTCNRGGFGVVPISGWGNYPRRDTRLLTARDPDDLPRWIAVSAAIIARGAGRAYGDAAIGCDATLSMAGLDRMIAFDGATASLTVEAGVTLEKILETFVGRGFFPPVVPGTRHVTVGGMLAANVHGKNHHKSGGFGNHVERLTLIAADGSQLNCSPTENADMFRATIGGMGLTGVIREVTFRLHPIESAFIRNETVVASDLDAIFRAFEASRDWTYTVAWIDCLARGASMGRSVLFRGEHARRDELDGRHRTSHGFEARRRPAIPFYLPGFILNRWSVSAFNSLYFNGHEPGAAVVPLLRYFFPLDAIGQWNRLYGRRGFVQYQCVIPKPRSRSALGEILELVSLRGSPSFLAVLKLLGPDDAGLISFPLEGYTLTLDFPATETTFRLLAELDRCVMAHGGRIYLAKDACQSQALVEAGYPNVNAFRELRRGTGAGAKFRSLQSKRLSL
jgi:FAD/FMN-containing dehydrogenase